MSCARMIARLRRIYANARVCCSLTAQMFVPGRKKHKMDDLRRSTESNLRHRALNLVQHLLVNSKYICERGQARPRSHNFSVSFRRLRVRRLVHEDNFTMRERNFDLRFVERLLDKLRHGIDDVEIVLALTEWTH